MVMPSNNIFINNCMALDSTWVVSGLVYLNTEDEPADMDISRSFDSVEGAISYAKGIAHSSKLNSLIFLNNSLFEGLGTY
jgi:hypothetical protein